MIKAALLVLLAVGILFLVLGINASHALSPEGSRFFAGSPTYNATLMIIGGVVGTVAGLAGLIVAWRRG